MSISMWSSMKALILEDTAAMPISIAAAFAIIAILIVLFVFLKRRLSRNPVRDRNSLVTRLGMRRGMRKYSVEDLKQATNNFGKYNCIGSGTLGLTYIGLLEDTFVAIKRLAGPPHPRFLDEVINMSNIRHFNLVKLLGYCCEKEEQILVYEYMANGSLRDYLRGTINLDFERRLYIALGAARGLLHLRRLTPPFEHNRFHTTKVLLDVFLNAKVSDVGLSRLLETRYENAKDDYDIEFNFHNQEFFNRTSDVYTFGLFLVELITGQDPGALRSHYEMDQWIAPRVWLDSFADQRMNGTFTREEMDSVKEIMLKCLAFSVIERPKMEKIVMDLEKIYLNYFTVDNLL